MKEAFFYFFLFLVAISLLVLRSLLIQPFLKNPDLSSETIQNFLIIAHRGASAYAPENTIPAFEKALKNGADMVELDVHLTQDGEVVVLHDAMLDRTTDGFGPVHLRSLAELKQLDAGSWFSSEFQGVTIPTLSEVLDTLKGKTKLLIELKTGQEDEEGFIYENLASQVVDILKKHQAFSWCTLQSFELSYLTEIKKIAPKADVQQLVITDLSPFPLYISNGIQTGNLPANKQFSSVNPYFKSLTGWKVKDWHKKGYSVIPYTVNELDDMYMLLGMGVDGIITDYPDRLASIRLALQKKYLRL